MTKNLIKKIGTGIALVGALVGTAYAGNSKKVTNFQECVDAGYTVFEINPPFCKTPDGKVFREVEKKVTNFQECVDAGYIVFEINPPYCTTDDGKVFAKAEKKFDPRNW